MPKFSGQLLSTEARLVDDLSQINSDLACGRYSESDNGRTLRNRRQNALKAFTTLYDGVYTEDSLEDLKKEQKVLENKIHNTIHEASKMPFQYRLGELSKELQRKHLKIFRMGILKADLRVPN
jgi:hypothetical protein